MCGDCACVGSSLWMCGDCACVGSSLWDVVIVHVLGRRCGCGDCACVGSSLWMW